MEEYDFVQKYFWVSLNGKSGIFDIEGIKKLAFHTVTIDDCNKISHPNFNDFVSLVFLINSNLIRYKEFGVKAKLNNLDEEIVKNEIKNQLNYRASKAFYGEAIISRSFLLIPGSSFESIERMKDIDWAVDGLFRLRDKSIYIQIKSSSYYNDMKKIKDEKIKQNNANLNHPSAHLFYNFDFETPYIMSEYGHKFFFEKMTVDVNELEKFFLERVFK